MSDTLDYRTVRHVDLTALQAVVKAWKKLPEDFREVHTSFDRTVTKPMSTERSGWHGDSQKAAVKHFTVVQNQVTEAAGQAEWLGKEMSRCLKVFEGAKKDLTEGSRVHDRREARGWRGQLSEAGLQGRPCACRLARRRGQERRQEGRREPCEPQ